MARRKRAWGPSNPLWRWQHGKSKAHRAHRRVNTMARRYGRRRGRSRGGFGMGRLLSTKNILFTLGGAYLGSRMLGNSQLGAGAGGFMAAGPVGGIVGYVLGPTVLNMIPGFGGGVSGGSDI